MSYEKVDRPAHYGDDLQAIDVIELFKLDFHLGNVVKYVLRAGKKPDADTLTDLKKAAWYLNRYVGSLQAAVDQADMIEAVHEEQLRAKQLAESVEERLARAEALKALAARTSL